MNTTSFKCPYDDCQMSYKYEKYLARHIEALHSASLKYECSVCKKRLSSLQNLREHKNLHTGDTPYVCKEPGCGFRAKQGSQLSAHKKTHQPVVRESRDFMYLKVTFT